MYNTLQELMAAIQAVKAESPAKVREQQETLANEYLHLLPNDLDSISDFLNISFASEQTEWGGAFLSLIRKKGCEILTTTLEKTTADERANLALTYSEFFIWSDGHFFLETLKLLPKDTRILFATAVFNLPSAQRELKGVKNFWSIIFLAESICFLPIDAAETFKQNLSDHLNKGYFDGGKGWDNLCTGVCTELPSPSPEYLIGALYCITNPNARFVFAKNILVSDKSDPTLYRKPSIEFLIRTLMALDPENYKAFIEYFITQIPLTSEEIQQAKNMTKDTANQIMWGNTQSDEECNPKIGAIAAAVATAFQSSTFNVFPQPENLPKEGPADLHRVKAAYTYLANLSRLPIDQRLAFARKHADVLIWTDTRFFLEAMDLIAAKDRLAFLKHTFDLGTAELKGCKTPWSIVGCLTAIADLRTPQQQEAVDYFKRKTNTINWSNVVSDLLKKAAMPETPNADDLVGLLYLLEQKDRFEIAKKILTIQPSKNLWLWSEKPSVNFLKNTVKALPENQRMEYIDYFLKTMQSTLTKKELADIDSLKQEISQPKPVIPAPKPVIPAPKPVIPAPVNVIPAPTPTGSGNFNAVMCDILREYIATQKKTWQYRWADAKLSPLPGFLQSLFKAVFKRHKKVERAEQALIKLNANEAPEDAINQLNGMDAGEVTQKLTPGIFPGFSRGLLEKKIDAKLGIAAKPTKTM